MDLPPVYINGRFLSQSLTGVQRFAIELVKALDAGLSNRPERPLPARVVLLHPSNAVSPTGLRTIESRSVGRLGGHLWDQLELPLFARNGVLVSLCNTGPLLHRHQIVAFHDAAIYANPANFSRPYRTWHKVLRPLLGRTAVRVVTVSEFSKGELMRHCRIPEAKFTVIHNGADHILACRPRDGILRGNGIRPGGYVLALGSMSPNKRFGMIADAFVRLGRGDLQLVVAGGANPAVFTAHGMRERSGVVTVGRVDDGELRALYDNALCFVFPSAYEGFGIPPLEAMACGCPVIVASTSSLPEVCGDAALYCSPDDVGELTACIRQIADDEAVRVRFGNRGVERARLFSWRASAEQMWRLIMETAREMHDDKGAYGN